MLDVKPISNSGAGASEHKCDSEHFSFISYAIIRVEIKSHSDQLTTFLLCRNCAVNLAALLQEQVRNIDNSKS